MKKLLLIAFLAFSINAIAQKPAVKTGEYASYTDWSLYWILKLNNDNTFKYTMHTKFGGYNITGKWKASGKNVTLYNYKRVKILDKPEMPRKWKLQGCGLKAAPKHGKNTNLCLEYQEGEKDTEGVKN